MSRQSSQLPEEGRATSASKKRHGRFEIWGRYADVKRRKFWGVKGDGWGRVRKYETRELAEKNLAKVRREMSSLWEYEIREIE